MTEERIAVRVEDGSRQKVFLPRIESFRGLAACVVGVHHTLSVLKSDEPPGWGLATLQHLFNGKAAVLVFFVLSGFVLGLSLDLPEPRNAISNYAKFVARRFLRIYPAFLFSLAVILSYLFFLHHPMHYAAGSVWFNQWYQSLPQWTNAIDILTFKDIQVNNVAWTLRSEIICSCLLPPLHWVQRRLPLIGNMVVLTAILAGSRLLQNQFVGNLYLFYLGLCVPSLIRLKFVGRPTMHPLHYVALFICFVGALQAGRETWMHNPMLAFLPGFGAFAFVLFVAVERHSWLHRILNSPVARFYGRISYSFYLLHFIVLYTIAAAVLPHFDDPTARSHYLSLSFFLIVTSVVAVTPLAYASWRWIEVPFIRLSKRFLTARFTDPPM